MIAVFKREFKAYFSSPLGYIFMGLFLLIAGFFYTFTILLAQSSYYNAFLSNILFIFMFVVPILTMRLMSEEKRNKTDQLLITSPLRISEIVMGKFLAAATVFLLTLLVTVIHAVLVAVHGDLEVAETITGYIGFILMGISFISVGLFISTTTENQVIAAVVTFSTLLFLWLMEFIRQNVPADPAAGAVFGGLIVFAVAVYVYLSTRNYWVAGALLVVGAAVIVPLFFLKRELFVGFISRTIGWLSLLKRQESFSMAILKLEDVIYYLSFTGLFLFLSVRVIEKRRWS